MDTKDSRWKAPLKFGPQRRSMQAKWIALFHLFQAWHRQILTGIFLATILLLLLTFLQQIPWPVRDPAPAGVVIVDYSSLVKEGQAGHVLAATFRGTEVNALLTHPFSSEDKQVPAEARTSFSAEETADIEAWSGYVHGEASWPNVANASEINPTRAIYTYVPADDETALNAILIANNAFILNLPVSQPSPWLLLFWRLLPILIVCGLLLLLLASRKGSSLNQITNDNMSEMGKHRAHHFENRQEREKKKHVSKSNIDKGREFSDGVAPSIGAEPTVTFADVAGMDEVRLELEEIVRFLRSPEQFHRLGARIPRGALLVGAPGTGKTLLARAVAGEAGVPFFSISASEFVEMYVGVGASRVRDLFNKAHQASPCVIFIDEIDAVGRKRSTRMGGSDERDQTLNQLLVELDGFDAHQSIVVLAATNRIDILDHALLRPGRFDRHITISLPDRAGRQAILKVHTVKTPLGADVDLERLARLTTGMSGADLANLVNEAALVAARRNLEMLEHTCFDEALSRIQLGALRPIVMSEAEKKIIAYHEAGHALVAHYQPEADGVNQVTILPRGQSLGVTQFIAEEDRYNYSRQVLLAKIAVGLGGRLAEELTFGSEHITTGAENDLQVVTDLARRMVTRWGMSKQVGVIFTDTQGEPTMGLNMRLNNDFTLQARSLAYHPESGFQWNGHALQERARQFSMSTPSPQWNGRSFAALIDSEILEILHEGQSMARVVLQEHREELTYLAEALIEREHLNRSEFQALLGYSN